MPTFLTPEVAVNVLTEFPLASSMLAIKPIFVDPPFGNTPKATFTAWLSTKLAWSVLIMICSLPFGEPPLWQYPPEHVCPLDAGEPLRPEGEPPEFV